MPGHRFSASAQESHSDPSIVNFYGNPMYSWVHWGREESREWVTAGRWSFSFFLAEADALSVTGLFIMYLFTFYSRALFSFPVLKKAACISRLYLKPRRKPCSKCRSGSLYGSSRKSDTASLEHLGGRARSSPARLGQQSGVPWGYATGGANGRWARRITKLGIS